MASSRCWENKVAFEGLENLVTESITGVVEVVLLELVRAPSSACFEIAGSGTWNPFQGTPTSVYRKMY